MQVMKKRFQKYCPYLLIILAAFIILSVQLSNHMTIVGFDSYFHMSRAYETANQLKTGHFSYFLSLFSWLGSGRIVNALYGPIGGYIMGIILLIAHSWYHWEIIMDLIVLIGSGSTMFILGRYWKDDVVVNIIISIIYMVSYPPMIFVSNNEFTGVGAIFVPLIVLVSSKILVTKKLPVIKLIILMTVIAEVHLMTLVISTLFLIPFIITGFIKTNKKVKYTMSLLKSIIWTVLLTINVWGSILEVMLSNSHHLIPTFPTTANMAARSYDTIKLSDGSISVIGGAIAIACIICVVVWILTFSTGNTVVNTLMCTGTFFLWMSTQWFPWKFIQNTFPIVDIFQFPKRFVAFGIVPMLIALGALVTPLYKLHHPACKILVLVFLAILGFESWNYNNIWYHYRIAQYKSPTVITWSTTKKLHYKSPSQLRDSLSAHNPNDFMHIVSKPVPDYLPTRTYYKPSKYDKMASYWKDYTQYIIPLRNEKRYQQSVTNHAIKRVKITVNYSGLHRIPFTLYKHTDVLVNGKHASVHPSRVGAIWVYLHAGTNTLSLKYRPSYWFEIGIIVNILALISFLLIIKWKREDVKIMMIKHQS